MNSDKSKSKVIQIPYLHETEVVTEIVVEVIFIIGIIEHFIVWERKNILFIKIIIENPSVVVLVKIKNVKKIKILNIFNLEVSVVLD